MSEILIDYSTDTWVDFANFADDIPTFAAGLGEALETPADASELARVLSLAANTVVGADAAFLLSVVPVLPLVVARLDIEGLDEGQPTVAAEAQAIEDKDSVRHNVITLADGSTAIRSLALVPIGHVDPAHAEDDDQPLVAAVAYRKDIVVNSAPAVATISLVTGRLGIVPQLDPLLLDLLAATRAADSAP